MIRSWKLYRLVKLLIEYTFAVWLVGNNVFFLWVFFFFAAFLFPSFYYIYIRANLKQDKRIYFSSFLFVIFYGMIPFSFFKFYMKSKSKIVHMHSFFLKLDDWNEVERDTVCKFKICLLQYRLELRNLAILKTII